MEHEYFRDRVSAYFDRSLPIQEQVIVEEHIRGCAECQKLLDEIGKLERLVQAQGKLGGADEYWEKSARQIEKRLDLEEETEIVDVRRSWWFSGFGWKIAAAAASIVLLGYIGLRKSDIFEQRETRFPATIVEKGKASPENTIPSEQKDEVAPKSGEQTPSVAPSREPAIQQQSARSEKLTEESAVSRKQKQTVPLQNAATKEFAAVPAVVGKDTESRIGAPSVTGKIQPNSVAALADSEVRSASRRDVAEDVGATSDSVGALAELDYWRLVKDSLLAGTFAGKSDLTKKLNIPTATVQGLTAEKSLTATAKTQQSRLLEAYYNIARLTTDSSEYQSAREIIEKVDSDTISAVRRAAAVYLEKLDKR